jgi:hypothetical protein
MSLVTGITNYILTCHCASAFSRSRYCSFRCFFRDDFGNSLPSRYAYFELNISETDTCLIGLPSCVSNHWPSSFWLTLSWCEMHRPEGLAEGAPLQSDLRGVGTKTWTQTHRIDSSCITHFPRSCHLLLSENMLSDALFTLTDHSSPSPLEPEPHHWAGVKLGCLLHPDNGNGSTLIGL